jgi:hypothetical protein
LELTLQKIPNSNEMKKGFFDIKIYNSLYYTQPNGIGSIVFGKWETHGIDIFIACLQ